MSRINPEIFAYVFLVTRRKPMPRSNPWKIFVNEINILIGEVQSPKKLYQTLKRYLNLNSCPDIFQIYLLARRTNFNVLEKIILESFLNLLSESRPSQAWLLHLTVKLAWLIVSYNRREGPHNFLIHI